MCVVIIFECNVLLVVGDFCEFELQEGVVLIDVEIVGFGGWDVFGVYCLGVEYFCVICGEGVGCVFDGWCVYFGECLVILFGVWVECILVFVVEVWVVLDEVDDKIVISMGIVVIGVIVLLEKVVIQKGEKVLIFGVIGIFGQIVL